jgi:hypothetical protein
MRRPDNIFVMDEWAAKSFLHALTGMVGGGPEQLPPAINLPIIEPSGLYEGVKGREEDERYPVAQFRDGLALLSRLPRSHRPETHIWSSRQGVM